MNVPNIKIRLTGWKAVTATLGCGVLIIVQGAIHTSTLQDDGVQALQSWLHSEAGRLAVPIMQAELEGERNPETLSRIVTGLESAKFEILSVSARKSGERWVVRADVSSNVGGTAQRELRYFYMTHSMLTGWRVTGRASKFAYYSALF